MSHPARRVLLSGITRDSADRHAFAPRSALPRLIAYLQSCDVLSCRKAQAVRYPNAVVANVYFPCLLSQTRILA